jgi:hypothetical protein
MLRAISKSIVAVLTATISLAQAQGPKATLEQQLEPEYKLTTPTADNTDIVTTGSVLILQKKGFSTGAVSNKIPTLNTYKDGQIKSALPRGQDALLIYRAFPFPYPTLEPQGTSHG